ncbi:MAG TPA: threonine/serine dehydratase [Vicinamibacterales bacterium]
MLVTIDEVRAAAIRVRDVVPETALIAVGPARLGAVAFALKCEHLTSIGAFKLRGAYNLMAQLPPEQRAGGVVTFSSGNHAQAVARSAQLLGVAAVVVMPTTAPPLKIERTRQYGAEVILEGTTSVERQARAEAEAARRGMVIVPPFDDARIIAGAGTVGLEIVGQVSGLRTVFVPVGGGGLLSGIAVAVRALAPKAVVVGVEPTGGACMAASLAAGHPVTLARTASMADGLLPVRPGDLTFQHAQALVQEVRTVDETAIADALRWIYDATGMMVEPSGAVGVAAALAEGPTRLGVVAVVSGGNVAPEAFRALTGRGGPGNLSAPGLVSG